MSGQQEPSLWQRFTARLSPFEIVVGSVGTLAAVLAILAFFGSVGPDQKAGPSTSSSIASSATAAVESHLAGPATDDRLSVSPNPVATPSPTPSPTPVGPFSADWSGGLSAWTTTEDWRVVKGQLVSDGTNGNSVAQPDWTPVSPDYTVAAKVELIRNQACFRFGLFARFASDRDGFMMSIGNTNPRGGTFCGDPYLILWDGHEVVETVPFIPGAGPRVYELSADGDTVTLRIDGSVKLSVRDTLNAEPGHAGMFSIGSQISVESFQVTYP